MANVRITTSQAPDAKPVGVSRTISTTWQVIINVPEYEVPEQTFGGSTLIVPGAVEIISPMLVCNNTGSTVLLSLRMFRVNLNSYFSVVTNMPIPPNDIVTIPLNGQFLVSDEQAGLCDQLEAICDTTDGLDITISYTVGQPEQDDVA